MPTIPTAEPTVRSQVPALKQGQMPRAVPGAFGELTAKAGAEMAGAVGDIGKMFEQRADQMAKVKNAELENEFIMGNMDILHNNRTKDIVDPATGLVRTIPDGLLDRPLYDAKDVSIEYEQRSAELRDKIIAQQPIGIYRSELGNRITTHYLNSREDSIKYEVSETRKAAKDKYDTLGKTYVEGVKAHPEKLGEQIDLITKNRIVEQSTLYTSKEQMELDIANDVAKAATNAGITILETGGDIDDSKALIDSVRDKIPPEKYTQIISDIETRSKAIATLKDWQIKQAQTQGAFDLTKQLRDHTLTPDIVRTYMQAGIIDAETAAIFNKVSVNAKLNIPKETELTGADALLNLLDKTIKDKDEKATMNAIKDATTLYGKGKLGFYQYAYFIQGLNQKFDNEKKGQSWSDNMIKFNNAAKSLQSVAKAISFENVVELTNEMVNKLLTKVNTGMDPNIAAQQVHKETVLELHPNAVTYPEEGKTTMDKYGNIKKILPDGTISDVEAKQKAETTPNRKKGK